MILESYSVASVADKKYPNAIIVTAQNNCYNGSICIFSDKFEDVEKVLMLVGFESAL
jgi:hypothetical protein